MADDDKEARMASFAAMLQSQGAAAPTETLETVEATTPQRNALLLGQKCFDAKPRVDLVSGIPEFVGALEGVPVSAVKADNWILAFDQVPTGPGGQNQNRFANFSLAFLEVVGYTKETVGDKWTLDLRVLPTVFPRIPSAFSLFQEGVVVRFKKLDGQLLTISSGDEPGWIENFARKAFEDAASAAEAARGAPNSEVVVGQKRKDAGLGNIADSNKNRRGVSMTSTGQEYDRFGNLIVEVPDDDDADGVQAGTGLITGTVFKAGYSVGLDLNGRQWHVSDKTGQVAVDRNAFLLRVWPRSLIELMLPGQVWNFDKFMDHALSISTIVMSESGGCGNVDTVSAEPRSLTDPAVFRMLELTGLPIMAPHNIDKFEAFVRGILHIRESGVLGVIFQDLVENSQDLVVARKFGKASTAEGRRVISRMVRTFGRMGQVFWIDGFELCWSELVDDLASINSSFSWISDLVTCKEVWNQLATWVKTASTIKAVKQKDAAGHETSNTLDSPEKLLALGCNMGRSLMTMAAKRPDMWRFDDYQSILALHEQFATSSPKKAKQVVSDADEETDKAAAKAKKADKKKAQKAKKDAAQGGNVPTVKAKNHTVCHYQVGGFLGTLRMDGEKVVCEAGVKCPNTHVAKLTNIRKDQFQALVDLQGTPAKTKKDIRAHMLTL